jgi:hypothetical protein
VRFILSAFSSETFGYFQEKVIYTRSAVPCSLKKKGVRKWDDVFQNTPDLPRVKLSYGNSPGSFLG